MQSVIRSLVFYAVFYVATVLFVIAAQLALLFSVDAMRTVANGWSAFHLACVRYILGIEIVEQGDRPAGAAFYALKHESFFDALNLACVLPNPVAFAKVELFKIPLWGRAARAYGIVPVARKEGAKALRFMLSETERLKAAGRTFVIFPEGTRVPHGRHPRLRPGFAALYKLLGLPVVPVAIDSGPLYAGVWKKRGTITLRFGEPIPPGLPREEIEQRVQAGINALNPAD